MLETRVKHGKTNHEDKGINKDEGLKDEIENEKRIAILVFLVVRKVTDY
jgi:hypothetical protein